MMMISVVVLMDFTVTQFRRIKTAHVVGKSM